MWRYRIGRVLLEILQSISATFKDMGSWLGQDVLAITAFKSLMQFFAVVTDQLMLQEHNAMDQANRQCAEFSAYTGFCFYSGSYSRM